MKPVHGLLLLVFLLSYSLANGQKENNSVLDKKITVEATNASIASILEKISLQTHVFFSYDASLIESEKLTSISVSNKTIQETLDLLFDSKFFYKALDDQIIIAAPEAEKFKKKDTDSTSLKLPFIIFRGKIIDREEKDILPYVSISVLRKPLGTISNSDGEFVLKIPENLKQDTVLISCLGFRQYFQPISEINDTGYIIYLQPFSVQLKEIKVTVINPEEIIKKILSKIPLNYPHNPEIMTAFYREVLKQDGKYIDVAEAVMEIRKASYESSFSQDKIKFIKGRKNLNVIPFKSVDFKIQGGPYYITKLDVVKTLDSFLDPDFMEFYKYSLNEIISLDNRDTYVIGFKPKEKVDYPCYQGKLYVDMSTFALVRAVFSLSRSGLKFARESLIKKKPKDFFVRPIEADYKVNYRRVDNKWHLSNAQTSVRFKVKSKEEKVNSTFHSVSDMLITDFKPDDGTQFKRNELFNPKDIFTELITTYDENFWENYNTIKPSEGLRNALRDYYQKNDTLFRINEIKKPTSHN